MKEDKEKTGDEIFEELGDFGPFQILNSILIFIPLTLSAWYGLSFVFTARDTPHRCVIPECETGEFLPTWLKNATPFKDLNYDRCHRFTPNNKSVDTYFNVTECPFDLFDSKSHFKCKDFIYSDNNTIVSEFNLGCQEWKISLIGTMNNVGQLIGFPLSGWISDSFGRRFALSVGVFLTFISGISRSFSPGYLTYLILETLDGAVQAGVYGAGFILCVEFVGPKYRIMISSLISYSYAIGEILLGLIAWRFPYWRVLLRILYVPSIFLTCYFWILPESVRWLLSKGKFKETEATLNRVAKMNGTKLTQKSLDCLINSAQSNIISNDDTESVTKRKSKHILYRLLSSRILLVRMACSYLWWITCSFVYYGLSLNSVSISGNMYLNFILVSLIEIPGYFVYYLVVDRFGRRHSLCWSFLFSGISCFIYLVIPSGNLWLQISVYLFGKFSITVAFTVLYVYTTELFPTPMRASVLGICSMFGRFGSIVAPQTPLLSIYMKSLPLLLFGGTSICAGLTVLAFPETNNIKLPDTIEEAEAISKLIPKRNENSEETTHFN